MVWCAYAAREGQLTHDPSSASKHFGGYLLSPVTGCALRKRRNKHCEDEIDRGRCGESDVARHRVTECYRDHGKLSNDTQDYDNSVAHGVDCHLPVTPAEQRMALAVMWMKGSVASTKAFLPMMLEQRERCIVNVRASSACWRSPLRAPTTCQNLLCAA